MPPVPPLTTATIPVTFADVPDVFWFKTGTSALAMVPHAGVFAVPPDPVEVRKFFVLAVLPAREAAASAADS